MRYYKMINDGYVTSIGAGGAGGTEITESEYNEIMTVIQTKPEATETTDYQLKEDLTWEPYEVEPVTDPDIDDTEAPNIILGGIE